MLCQECQKRKANVHFTKIVNGYKTELHLCEVCAQEKGEMEMSYDFEPKFSIQDLLTGLLNYGGISSPVEVSYPTKLQCSNCGLTFAQFGQIGRFGCSNCYATFEERLHPLLRRIHGSQNHVGKIPRRAGYEVHLQRKMEQLQEKMQRHVAREEFEEAARLRDQIRELEKKRGKEKGDG